MRQFDNVSSKYGAPMGRASFGNPESKIRLFRVRLDSGGYDDGGAYWGLGQALYCATDGADYRKFVRANSRLAAIAELDIERHMLKRPPILEFKIWEALSGGNIEHLNDSGRPVFLKLKELGF